MKVIKTQELYIGKDELQTAFGIARFDTVQVMVVMEDGASIPGGIIEADKFDGLKMVVKVEETKRRRSLTEETQP